MQDKDLAVGDLSIGQRPALILVDMSVGFTDPASPLGGDFEDVIEANRALLHAFRLRDLPVFFTTVVYHNSEEASVFRQRLPDLNILNADSPWINIHPSLQPSSQEKIITKQGPSGFFNTQLAHELKLAEADSVVVTGLTTSGCVRATVVDALQYNYPTFVVEEACGDRNTKAHQANLYDMHAKYAVVCELKSILTMLA